MGGIDGITCPRPVELIPGPVPVIRMARVSGTPLLGLLRSQPVDARLLSRLTEAAARAVVVYVDAVGEPYHDFQFDNMLYDAASGSVVFVDFGLPDHAGDVARPTMPLEISLGNLVGSTIFQSARPKWLLERRQHRQAVDLCKAVVCRVTATSDRSVSMDSLHMEADLAYRRCAFGGGWRRDAWYGSAGHLVARRVQVGTTDFGPSRHRRPLGPTPPGPQR